MASKVFECEICSESYDSDERSPICLSCGHTYCRECLLDIADDSAQCPACRQPITSPISQLPVIYALIPSERKSVAETADRCQAHGCELENFCVNCKLIICPKCVIKYHSDHRVAAKEDVFNEEGQTPDFVLDLLSELEANVVCLSKSITAAGKIRNYIQKLEKYTGEIQQWEDVLLSKKASATQRLEEWKTAAAKSDKEKSELFIALPRHLQNDADTLSNDSLVSNIESKLSELQRNAEDIKKLLPVLAPANLSLEASFGTAKDSELLEDDTEWSVYSNDDVRRALASVRDDRRPSSLTVESTAGEPIRMFPTVLNILGSACLGSITVRDLPSFWGSSTKAYESLNTFIKKHGHKVDEFFGSSDDAAAIAFVKGKSWIRLGVGVSNLDDSLRMPFDVGTRNISFHRSLWSKDEVIKKPLGLEVGALHFPDLHSGDQGWMATLQIEYLNQKSKRRAPALYLPRCHLSEDDLRILLGNSCVNDSTIFCQHVSLSKKACKRLEALAKKKKINIFWNGNMRGRGIF